MIYIGYSELTKRYYLIPKSKKESKVDITNDIKEIIEFEKQKPENKEVEQAAKEFADKMQPDPDPNKSNYSTNGDHWDDLYYSFTEGAKWQSQKQDAKEG